MQNLTGETLLDRQSGELTRQDSDTKEVSEPWNRYRRASNVRKEVSQGLR